MNPGVIQRFLLTTLLVTYFLIPTTLPWTGWSPHGLVLLCAMLCYFVTDLRRFSLRKSWPFALLLFAVGASWLWVGGDADIGMVRSVGFGIFAAFLVSEYLRGHHGIRALVVLASIVAAASVFMSGSYIAATFGANVTQFDPFAALFGQSSYHSALFFLVAIPAVSFFAARSGMMMASLLLLPLWMGLIISGIRGVWLGAIVAVLAFGMASKRLWHTAVSVGIAFLAFTIMTSLTERYLDSVNQIEKAQSVGAKQMSAEDRPGEGQFAPVTDSSATTLAAAALAAKTRSSTGRDKLYEELTTSGRMGYWLTGIRMWAASPVLGVGPGNFARNSELYSIHSARRRDAEKAFDAHNMFVSILAELGIVGFGMLVALVVVPVRRWFRCWQEKPSSRDALALVGAVFAGLTVVGMTWDIHMQRIWWISLGLFWAATVRSTMPEEHEDVS